MMSSVRCQSVFHKLLGHLCVLKVIDKFWVHNDERSKKSNYSSTKHEKTEASQTR